MKLTRTDAEREARWSAKPVWRRSFALLPVGMIDGSIRWLEPYEWAYLPNLRWSRLSPMMRIARRTLGSTDLPDWNQSTTRPPAPTPTKPTAPPPMRPLR